MRSLPVPFRLPVSAALVVALAACGSGGRADDSHPVEVVVFGDAAEAQAFTSLAARFTAEHPETPVTVSTVAKEDDLLARLTTSVAGGAPPDSFLINYRKYGGFAASGVLTPVQPFLDQSDVIAEHDFFAPSLEAFRFDGSELMCMPQNVSSLQVYVNLDRFEAAGVPVPERGWTWDEFVAAAKRLTTGDGVYGVGTEVKVIRVAPFIWSNGGDVVDDHLDPTRLTLDEPKARAALDAFLDLALVHGVAPPAREEEAMSSEARFLRGDLGMFLDSRKVVPGFRAIDGFAWDVVPLPTMPGGEPAGILHADAFCMTKAGGRPEATWRFIEYAMSEEGQRFLAASGRSVPVRESVATSPAFLQPDEPPASSSVWVDAIPHLRAVPSVAAWAQTEKEVDKLLAEIFYGRLDREAGVDQIVRTAERLLAGGAAE